MHTPSRGQASNELSYSRLLATVCSDLWTKKQYVKLVLSKAKTFLQPYRLKRATNKEKNCLFIYEVGVPKSRIYVFFNA
jgi:hypothetical protein